MCGDVAVSIDRLLAVQKRDETEIRRSCGSGEEALEVLPLRFHLIPK